MSKPNESFTVAQMKTYIREKKVNHPEVKLGMKKADMIAGLKKAGHWDSSVSKKAPAKKAPAKKALAKKAPAKKAPAKSTTTDALFNLPSDVGEKILAQRMPSKIWNPLNSPTAPVNKWTPCMVFTITGKSPKQYECKYMLNVPFPDVDSSHLPPAIRPPKRPNQSVVFIKGISGKQKGVIVAMGFLEGKEKDKIRPTQFRFSKDLVSVRTSEMVFVKESAKVMRQKKINRLSFLPLGLGRGDAVSNQPKNIRDYYSKPEFASVMNNSVYDMVSKFKFETYIDGYLEPDPNPPRITKIPEKLYLLGK